MKDYFTYNPGNLPEGSFKISPSQLSKFFDATAQWWREHYLDEAPAFEGSTASELGTCVHAAAAMYFDTKTVDKQAILNYIDSLPSSIDKTEIKTQLKPMVDTLINSFCVRSPMTHSEEFVSHEVLPGIYVAGSIDGYNHTTIFDYKTTSSKTIPTSFPRTYYFQLMTYAYILKQQGLDITTLKLLYITRTIDGGYSDKTGKKLKDYPSTYGELVHQITDTDWSLIEGCIKLIAESVQAVKSNPELLYLLAQDYRLKPPPKPILFKD